MRPLKIALLGFGTVGAALARILIERRELASRLTLTHVFNRRVARKRVAWIPASVAWTENIDEVFATEPDVIVEAIGGVGDAGDWVRRALGCGVSVVTANKMLVAAAGPALLELAQSTRVQLRFEAAVCGGIPVIHAIRDGLAGDSLTAVTGIVNGTSNYVLNRMESTGEPIEVALEGARQLGYAEVDPSADIDGDDAAAKLVVLACVAFGRHVPIEAIPRRSIREVTSADLRDAQRRGCAIRQIAHIEKADDDAAALRAFVEPTEVPRDSVFGRNEGANNVVMLRGSYGGVTTLSGAGAGGAPTAVAVLSDLLALQRGNGRFDGMWRPGRVIRCAGAFAHTVWNSAAPLALPAPLGV